MTPKLFVFEHGIQHHNELAHAGNDDRFGQFALSFQVLVEAFEDGVTLDG